jgi:hypothetical protein
VYLADMKDFAAMNKVYIDVSYPPGNSEIAFVLKPFSYHKTQVSSSTYACEVLLTGRSSWRWYRD